MIKTIKNFKWFFGVSFMCVLLGVFTFITFINQNFIFLNENNLQYLLILDVALLIIFLFFLIRETSKLFSEYSLKKTGSQTSFNYVLQFSLFAFIPSLIVAIFSLFIFNILDLLSLLCHLPGCYIHNLFHGIFVLQLSLSFYGN